jgi:hypothetical protein
MLEGVAAPLPKLLGEKSLIGGGEVSLGDVEVVLI